MPALLFGQTPFEAKLEIHELRQSIELPERSDPLISASFGAFNTTRHENDFSLQLEYKSPWSFLEGNIVFGGMITSRASTYIYTGINWDIFFGITKAFISPSFHPGIYFRGKGLDLGFPIELQSSIALGYMLDSGARMSCQYYHISNCHMGNHNPGVEGVQVNLSFPLERTLYALDKMKTAFWVK